MKEVIPTEVTNYYRTLDELQTFWIYCIIVAGKPADWASRVVTKFLGQRGKLTPFEYIETMGHGLHNTLVANRVGQYTRIEAALMQSLKLNLDSCTVNDLTSIHGIGPKTARFFLLHSRKDVEVAVLDTHVLKWLKQWFDVKVPKATPSGDRYLELERVALCFMKSEFPGMSIADADLLIWSMMSNRLSHDEVFDMTYPFESREGVDE